MLKQPPLDLHPALCQGLFRVIDDVGKDGDHMDDQEQGEERVEKQVAELVTFLPTVCSAAGSRSIWGQPAKWSPYV